MRSRRSSGSGSSWRSRSISLSVVARALAWTIVIRSAMTPPHPAPPLVFSAFSVGLFANAVLPGRIGELARVAVLTRKLPRAQGRVGDARRHGLRAPRLRRRAGRAARALRRRHREHPDVGAQQPRRRDLRRHRAVRVRVHQRAPPTHEVAAVEVASRARRLVAMARQGLGVMRSPLGAGGARSSSRSSAGSVQLFAVWTAMRAFDIHAPLPAAGVVLLLMNVVTIFPFWPGNVGLVQVAIASALGGLRRRVRPRHRVRVRAPGDRGVGRHRRRAAVPRARGALDGDAQGDAERRAGGGR